MCNDNIIKFIDIRYIRNLQKVLWRLYGFSFYILDNDGNTIVEWDQLQPICKLIKTYPRGKECCDMSDSAILGDVKLSRKMICRKCMAVGLTDAAIPIIVFGEHIATMFMGQVNSHGLTAEGVRKFAREIGADEKTMVRAYKKMPFMESSYMEPILELMKLLAENIASVIEANHTQQNVRNENQSNSMKIYKEYDMQIFMNELHQILFYNSEYTLETLEKAFEKIKTFFGFEKVSVYRDVSGEGTEFLPEVGDISDLKKISGDDISAVYGIEKYGFVCYDETNPLSKFINNSDCINVSLAVFADRKFSGFINMSSKNKKWIFSVSEINLFKNIALAVGNFYYRMYADKMLREAGLIKDNLFENTK